MSANNGPCVVGTWSFSQEPVRQAASSLLQGSTSLDALELGINVAEQDSSYGPYNVGCGGWQNADGNLELDAAIMDGSNLSFGAVTALQRYPRALSVARQVMEKSRHNMLTGEGAAKFARTQGFLPQDNLGRNSGGSKGHDTLGLLVLDRLGNVSAGVSTSGACGKEPGRVGDSALPGCGLYADSNAGAACCSGDGDEILKYCPSYRAVDLMKQSFAPEDACHMTVKEISNRLGNERSFEVVIIALDIKGNYGAANMGVPFWSDCITGREYPGFPYVVMNEKMQDAEILLSPAFK